MEQYFSRSRGLRFPGAILLLLLVACSSRRDGAAEPVFPAQPSREARAGFEWEEVSGAGLRFWSQRNDRLRVVVDADLPGARLERDGVTERVVMRVLCCDGEGPEALLARLERMPGRDASRRYLLREVPGGRQGVRRFELHPETAGSGECAMSGSMVAPSDFERRWCSDGDRIRYFELQARAPRRALFVDAGAEEPLFDLRSIVLTADSPEVSGARIVKGRLVLGHEVRAFTPCGDTCTYWVVDRTGTLVAEYDRITCGEKNGRAVVAELEVVGRGPSDDGFAAEYAGVYEVTKVIRMDPAAGR